jgi:hypothetical protein
MRVLVELEKVGAYKCRARKSGRARKWVTRECRGLLGEGDKGRVGLRLGLKFQGSDFRLG